MARIIGGLAVSHTPTIGFAVDHDKQEEAAWAPIFESFEPIRTWLQQRQPDVLFYIFNDHITSFFFDHYSAFTLGVDEQYGVADEGGNPRDLPPVGGHAALSRHIGQSLMADEFDMSFFRDKPLDHGFFSPMSALLPCDESWPVQIVPLQVGVLQLPIPTARRCYKLGQALRRAIESYPEDLKVAIVATGGVSHQVHGERCGFNNPEWDAQFLDLLVNDPQRLTEMTLAEYATLGGMEGAEVITWLIMRGALSANVERKHQSYYLPSMTGIATLLLENRDQALPAPVNERHRQHMQHQLAGAEQLEGHLSLHLGAQCQRLPPEQVLASHDRAAVAPALPERTRSAVPRGRPERRGKRPAAPPRLAWADPLRGDLLRTGEAGRRTGCVQPGHLRRHARAEHRRLHEDP